VVPPRRQVAQHLVPHRGGGIQGGRVREPRGRRGGGGGSGGRQRPPRGQDPVGIAVAQFLPLGRRPGGGPLALAPDRHRRVGQALAGVGEVEDAHRGGAVEVDDPLAPRRPVADHGHRPRRLHPPPLHLPPRQLGERGGIRAAAEVRQVGRLHRVRLGAGSHRADRQELDLARPGSGRRCGSGRSAGRGRSAAGGSVAPPPAAASRSAGRAVASSAGPAQRWPGRCPGGPWRAAPPPRHRPPPPARPRSPRGAPGASRRSREHRSPPRRASAPRAHGGASGNSFGSSHGSRSPSYRVAARPATPTTKL
jgi:hypothetical protein